MAKLLKLRRGTTTQHASFTGAEGEVTVDTTKDTLVVHDGSTQSGHTLLREDMSNLPAGTIDNADISNSAAIAGTKISPDFGSQTITTTGHITLPDQTSGSGKIKFGAGNDLQIYHDGSHSYLANTTGNLYINQPGYIQLGESNGGEKYATFQKDGAVELFHNNVKKIETFGNGIIVYGPEGGGGLVNLYADEGDDNADKWRIHANPNGSFYLQNYTSGSWENNLSATGNDGTSLYYDNSVKFETSSTGATLTGLLSTTSLAISSSGYISVPDSRKIFVGTGDDLQIYHDGSHSRIVNSTGDLVLQGADVYINSTNNQEHKAVFRDDDGVDLYYDGSLKFSTTASGWKSLDNVKGQFGTGGDLEISHDGSNSLITNSTGAFVNKGDDYRIKSYSTDENMICANVNGEVELYHNGVKKLFTKSTGIEVTGTARIDGNVDLYDNQRLRCGDSADLQIYHNGSHSYIDGAGGTGNLVLTCNGTNSVVIQPVTGENSIIGNSNNSVDLYYDHSHKFSTASTGVTVSNNNDLRIQGGSWAGDYTSGIKIQPTSNDSYFQFHGGLYFRRTNGASALSLTQTGDLTATGNVTAYSDARLKTNVNTINDALSIVGKLRGVSFDWKETGKPSIGVIAQEVEEVIPEVVLTNVNTDPATGETTEVKSVDYGKIVGVLINAINELKAEVDELKGGK